MLRNEKVKAISTLASGQDLLAVTRPIFSLFRVSTFAFASKTFARPKKTPVLQAMIYMVQCNRCNLQYIGETKRRLKDKDVTNTDV